MPESLLRTFSCDGRRPLQAARDENGDQQSPTNDVDRHRYYCRRLMRSLLLVANHPDYRLLLLSSQSSSSTKSKKRCYCNCTSTGSIKGPMCWCFSDDWLAPEVGDGASAAVGDDADWNQIVNDVHIQQGHPLHLSSTSSSVVGGRVSTLELTEAVSRAADLYTKRYILPSDDPDAPNTISNPIPNVVSLPCDPAGAFVMGPTRGHACDFANVLLEEWLGYDDWVKYYQKHHCDGDGNLKHQWVLDCLYHKLQATTVNKEAAAAPSDAPNKPKKVKTTPPLPDLVLIGSFVDGGQQSCEMLTLLSWLSLSLLQPPQYHLPTPSSPSNPTSSSPASSDSLSTLRRDRIVVIRGQHELLFPISSHITSHFVGRLDEELRLRFAITSTTPRPTITTTAPTQPRQQSPHTAPLELKELPHYLDYEALHRTLHPLLEVCPLDGHLKLCNGSSSLQLEAERLAYTLMDHLPIAAVLQGKYFCVGGGIPSSMRTIDELQNDILDTGRAIGGDDDGDAFDQLCEVMFSDPMGDDDERRLGHLAMFASNFERGLSHVYSFNAVCRFLRDNSLTCVIRGNPYTSHRFSQATNQMGRPWSYQYSQNDPGYQAYRINPDTGFPSIISLFSAPQFCSQNNNYGAFARVPPPPLSQSTTNTFKSRRSFSKKGKDQEDSSRFLQIHQFQAHTRRPLQLPGTSVSAFSWSLGMMSEFLYSAVSNMLAGDQIGTGEEESTKHAVHASYPKQRSIARDHTIEATTPQPAASGDTRCTATDDDATPSSCADQQVVVANNAAKRAPLPHISEKEDDAACREYAEMEVKNRVAKFHRLCQLLYKEELPLPSLSLLRGEIEESVEEEGCVAPTAPETRCTS